MSCVICKNKKCPKTDDVRASSDKEINRLNICTKIYN